MSFQRRVVCAAIRTKNGEIILGARHFDALMRRTNDLAEEAYQGFRFAEQGFIDQKGIFMTREEAWDVAKNANQIIRECGSCEGALYSENLY